jgi:hypothetical protein
VSNPGHCVTLADISPGGDGQTMTWHLKAREHAILRDALRRNLGPPDETVLVSAEGIEAITKVTEPHMIWEGDTTDGDDVS